MTEISIGIILLLILYTIVAVTDQISIQCGIYTPLFAATFTGLLLGDLALGLTVGATLQLMTLGVATYGGFIVFRYHAMMKWVDERKTDRAERFQCNDISSQPYFL